MAAQGSEDVSAFLILRVFRVLRPLRTIKRIQGLRILVVSLLKSLPMLLNIMIIVFFMLGVAQRFFVVPGQVSSCTGRLYYGAAHRG